MTTAKNAHGITWHRNSKAKTVTFRGGNLGKSVTVNEQYMLGRNYDTREDHVSFENDIDTRVNSFIDRHYDPTSPTGGLDAKTIRLKHQRVWDKVNKSEAGNVIWFDGKKLQVLPGDTRMQNSAIIAIKGGMLLVHWNDDQGRWLTADGCRYNACSKHRVIRYVLVLDNG